MLPFVFCVLTERDYSMTWDGAIHQLEVLSQSSMTWQTYSCECVQHRVNTATDCCSPLCSFTPSLPHSLPHTRTSSPLSHLDLVPMATHQPPIWVVSQRNAARNDWLWEMEIQHRRHYMLLHCLMAFFSLLLSFLSFFLNASLHYPPSSDSVPFILPPIHHPFVLILIWHLCLHPLSLCISSLSLSLSLSVFISLSAAMLWRLQRPAAVVGQSEERQHHLSETWHQLSLIWQRQV